MFIAMFMTNKCKRDCGDTRHAVLGRPFHVYRDGKPEKRRNCSVPDVKMQRPTMADFGCVLHREHMYVLLAIATPHPCTQRICVAKRLGESGQGRECDWW